MGLSATTGAVLAMGMLWIAGSGAFGVGDATGAVAHAAQENRRLTVDELPLGLPADLDAAAAILQAEDRRELTEALLRLSASPEASVRGRAALAIGRVGLPAGYLRLLEMVGDPEPSVRALASFGLGLLELDLEPALSAATRTRIAERLVTLLDDPEPVVIAQSLWALGIQGDPLAVSAVAAVLEDAARPPPVLEAALGAWWRLPGASPLMAAPHLASEEASVRFAAATALRRLDDPDALPALATALSDPDPLVRVAAMRGLHGAPVGVANRYLTTFLDDDDWRVVCAALNWTIALWQRQADLGDEVFTAVLRASAKRDRHVQRLALEALAWAPGRFSVPEDRVIIDIRSADPAKRSAAVAALSAGDGSLADDGLDAVREVYGMAAPPRESGVSEVPAMLATAPLEAAEVVRALVAAGETDADGWLPLLAAYGPEAARAEVLRQIETVNPEQAAAAAERLLRDGSSVLQAVAGEVIARLWAASALRGEGAQARWTDAIWDAQRDLAGTGALEPRLILLDAARSIDPATMRLRASALLPDPDRVIRLWALRNVPPEPNSRAAELIAEAIGPLETGRTLPDYRQLAEELIALQQTPPRLEVETSRGTFVWELQPAWAPLSARAYLDWVEAGFFDDMVFHRVVPDFVIQAGDPTAVGYGGAPGSLRSEETPIPYTPGTVGLALAGRDTGGSQFFVVHSPQPHLTGVYPVLGRVVEGGRFVDRIQPGDALRIRLAAGAVAENETGPVGRR
ncbi:MAG: peptidylprolyl isomerase [Acidobacteria bacterium]|nr:peptidylprolyl isomerase [Acidobacteriota bacterium]